MYRENRGYQMNGVRDWRLESRKLDWIFSSPGVLMMRAIGRDSGFKE